MPGGPSDPLSPKAYAARRHRLRLLYVCLFTERLIHLVFKADSVPQANPATPSCGSHASCQTNVPHDSLFERVGWFYAFLRVRLFRNDTEAIARALQLAEELPDPSHAPVLVEIGCGPGFYSCRLADGFPGWTVLGVDRSHEQLRRAREAARRSGLNNCEFRWGDAAALERADASDCREPRRPTILTAEHFKAVVSSQPWENVRCWEDGHYQYSSAQKRSTPDLRVGLRVR